VTGRARERLVIAPHLRRRTILAAIRSAHTHLALSIFRCDDLAVLNALAAAARRGVHVQALMTARARAAGPQLNALHAWLAGHGIDVRRYGGGMKYHAKFLVADGQLAVVTTLNYTARCLTRTCDFTLVSRDATVVSALAELFAADWALRLATFTPAQQDRLIVGPDHGPRERFAALVGEARWRLRIFDAKLSDPQIVARLGDRQRAGVAIETASRRDVRPLRRHGKLLVVDDAAAVIGSLSLSARALEHRRELAIVMREPRLVAELNAFWQAHAVPGPRAALAGVPAGRLELAS
jgi:phosphatidylserine/phosphatidylglycerophosphate/cardiolipin synthase-like enzyme